VAPPHREPGGLGPWTKRGKKVGVPVWKKRWLRKVEIGVPVVSPVGGLKGANRPKPKHGVSGVSGPPWVPGKFLWVGPNPWGPKGCSRKRFWFCTKGSRSPKVWNPKPRWPKSPRPNPKPLRGGLSVVQGGKVWVNQSPTGVQPCYTK